MTTDQEKWIEALARLTRKTREGEIKWKSIPAREMGFGNTLGVEKAFETTFKDQRIRAYRTDKALESWDYRERPHGERPHGERPRGELVIEFLDTTGRPVYRPPLLDGTKDLFSAIEYQAAPASDLIEYQTAPAARDFIDALLRD
jgi:hypothetical protein